MKNKLLATTCMLLLVASATAQNYKNEFGFTSDNDSYLAYGQDRYYTNGLMLYYRHALNQGRLIKLEKLTYEISAGQKIFNPISGYSPNPDKHDRPFAAYLYGSMALSFFTKTEGVFKTKLELGAIGPGALGQQAQEFMHRAAGFYPIQGWEYQIGKDFAANLSAQYTKLIHRSAHNKLDFSVDGYANLGTTFNGAGIGLLFRTGKINQLFNSASTHSIMSNNAKTDRLVGHEFFFYAKPQLNYIAYDATVSGSLFTNNSTITFSTKPFVFAQQLGINYSSPRFTIDYSMLFKSREIKSQAKAHQYATITLFYRFGK